MCFGREDFSMGDLYCEEGEFLFGENFGSQREYMLRGLL